MLIKYIRLSALLVICGLLAGCTKASSLNGESCMTPLLTEIPSPMPQMSHETMPNIPERQPMPEWWQPQLNLFQRMEYHSKLGRYSDYASDIVLLKDDLWISYDETVVRYDIVTGKLSYYKVSGPIKDNFYFDDLFVTSDGNLWAVGIDMSEDHHYTALAHYNPETDSVKVVADEDDLFRQAGINSNDNLSNDHIFGELPNGEVAIVIGGRVYSYDLSTDTAKLLPGLDPRYKVETIAVSNDGNIWFSEHTYDDLNIREFNMTTHKVTDYGPALETIDDLAMNTTAVKTLMVDSQNRVWVAYFNRLDPDGEKGYVWKNLERSPLFISVYLPDLIYGWTGVSNLYEFSDGNIWFETGMGVIKLDTKTDQWCWSSPHADSGIAEDQNGNLWIVADGQIYKTSILPQSAP